jgi:hypothetical protein
MATRKQIDASRRNAPRSTGPQTLAAKAVSFRIPLSLELRTRARPAPASKKPPAQALSSASENPLPLPQTRCSPAQRTQFETRSAFCPRLHARHLRLRHLPPPLQPRNAPPTLCYPVHRELERLRAPRPRPAGAILKYPECPRLRLSTCIATPIIRCWTGPAPFHSS